MEYVLLLVVVVGLILGLFVNFNEAFARYARNYFGDYLSCLIETGELPRLGGDTDGVCDSLYRPFTFTAGRPPIPEGPGSSSSRGNRDGSNSRSTPIEQSGGERVSDSDSAGGGGGRARIANAQGRIGGGGGGGSSGSRRFRAQTDDPYTGSNKVSTAQGDVLDGELGGRERKIKGSQALGAFPDDGADKRGKKL